MRTLLGGVPLAFLFGLIHPARDRHMTMNHAITAMLVFICGCLVWAIATMVYPYQQLTQYDMRVVGTPRAGETLRVAMHYCKAHDWPIDSLTWSLEDGIQISLEAAPIALPIGCHDVTVNLPVHEKIAGGVYILRREIRYSPWPWRDVSYDDRSQPFYLKGSAE